MPESNSKTATCNRVHTHVYACNRCICLQPVPIGLQPVPTDLQPGHMVLQPATGAHGPALAASDTWGCMGGGKGPDTCASGRTPTVYKVCTCTARMHVSYNTWYAGALALVHTNTSGAVVVWHTYSAPCSAHMRTCDSSRRRCDVMLHAMPYVMLYAMPYVMPYAMPYAMHHVMHNAMHYAMQGQAPATRAARRRCASRSRVG